MPAHNELIVVVTDASGRTKTLDSNAPDPADRPTNLQFSTQLASGFYTAGFELSRKIDSESADIHLLDDVKFIGANGDTAYEGFVQAMPRSLDAAHSLSVTATGWIAHAGERTFTEIFVDRDLTAWGPVSRVRRVTLVAASYRVYDPTVRVDPITGSSAVVTELRDQWAGVSGISEAWYDAGPGLKIAKVYYEWVHSTTFSHTDATWSWYVMSSGDDNTGGGLENTGSLRAAGPGSGTFTPTTPRRFAMLQLAYSAAGGAAGASYSVDWSKLAAYGNHGLTLIGTSSPLGVSASSVIRYLAARYCPLLNTAGVQTTTYPIGHLVFRDDTKPYDAFLRVNNFHLWQLAVWENRTIYYKPIDLTDWDWEVRHDEVGNTIGLQGDSTENLRNGVLVYYTDVATGARNRLSPDDYSQLRDDDIENPANQHGRNLWGEPFEIPWPTTAADALELGRIRLLEDNQVKAPGSFSLRGEVRDRAGHWQPAWKVRAGDRIRLTSSTNLSDRPRLIHETNYDHASRTVSVSVDSTARFLEGYIERVQTALTAAGFGS